ncbi:hypothetical protein [Citrifermentans bremense]|uniref:Uncharacterized protein n=1 Tax=Citrifermentans bremense TaxID=60035 RepID=A0A6S6LTR8_9BACT|nr:hypothetical protein [Citrifermentans bremense]
MTIRNLAIIMLMVVLTMPAAVHAYTLEVLAAETTHELGGGCHDTDGEAGHGPAGNHHSDVRCCELDTPYVIPSSLYLSAPAVTGLLTGAFSGRQLDGFARRVYKPPRKSSPVVSSVNS